MESAIAESESLYRTLIENSLDAVVLTQDFKFVYFNKVFCKMMGYSQEELFQIDPITIIAPEGRERIASYHRKRMRGEVFTQNYSTHFLRKDNSTFLADLKATNVHFIGKPASLITIRDITQREEMEKNMRESEAKYKALVENSQDSIMIIRDNRLLFANNSYCQMLGFEYFELLKMPAIAPLLPDDRIKARQIAEKRKAKDFSLIKESFRMLTKTGEIRECECIATVIEYDGSPASFMTLHDVTENKHMQDALTRSERRFRELTEMLPQAIYELDINNNPTFMNKTGREMFKMADHGHTGKKAYEFFSPKDTKRVKQDLENDAKNISIIDGELQPYPVRPAEYTAYRNDGTSFPVIIYGAPIVENGNVTGSRGIIVDISDRKAMEDALLESERKYRELADFMPQTLFELDNNMHLIYMNQTGMKLYGITNEEFGKFSPQYFLPEDLDKLGKNLRSIMEGKCSEVICEYTAIPKTGQKIPILTYALPVFKENRIVGVRGIIIDISERKATEQALRESEEKYRMLVDNANDGIILTQNGKLKLANKAMCDILRYESVELVEQSFYDYVVRDDRAEMAEYHRRRMSGEQFNILYRSHLIRKDGEIITAELNARTIYYNNQPAAFIIIRDISDRIIIEEELKNAKHELEILNKNLESRIKESSEKLAETHTQLLNLQKENIQSQFDVLRQQVNPHFLFNSLNVLTSLIKIEPDLAEQFSEHLSKVYRYVLENKDDKLVDLNSELRFLDAYIFLLNIRFVGKIKVNIQITNEMLTAKLIPLAMQLLIENAIKHNIMTKSQPLIIDIFIDPNHYLNIVNNLQERPSQIISTGVGLKNIENRYLLLNNTKPFFEKTETQFIAKIPLILK